MTVVTCIASVSYHEYLIHDFDDATDYAKVLEGRDGVLAPGHTGTVVVTGTPWGAVQLDIHLDEPLPALEELGVAARFSLFLPTGHLIISNPDLEVSWEAQVASGYCTLLVAVHNREQGSDQPIQDEPVERHDIFLVPGTAQLPRWRSAHTDSAIY